MRNILRKEMKLSASILPYLFVLFGFMFFLPGYPILCGAFFATLGLFQGFEYAREANDIVFSALLPIAKKDVVKGRFCFVCLIELCTNKKSGFVGINKLFDSFIDSIVILFCSVLLFIFIG